MMNVYSQTFNEQFKEVVTFWKEINNIYNVTDREDFHNKNEVHVWYATLECLNFYDLLSEEEKKTASRYRFPVDQQRYIKTHGLLRHLLSSYTGIDSSSIEIQRTKFGKPYITSQISKYSIQFNMSHSKDVVCIILSMNHEVGIDIEYVNQDFDWYNIASLYFTSHEINFLKALPREYRTKGFYNLWTRKEAILKASGTGLMDIENIGEIESHYVNKGFPIVPFTCENDYIGTFTVKNEVSEIRYYRIQEQS